MESNLDEVINWLSTSFAFFVRAKACLELKDFPGVVLNIQQSLEFSIKAMLISKGIQPKRSHDPGKQIFETLPEQNRSDQIQFLIEMSRELSGEYIYSRYPEEKSPFLIYDEERASELISANKTATVIVIDEISSLFAIKKSNLIEQVMASLSSEMQSKLKAEFQEILKAEKENGSS